MATTPLYISLCVIYALFVASLCQPPFCPTDQPVVPCLISPCNPLANPTCIGDTSATCTLDDCNGCNRHFVDAAGNRLSYDTCECNPRDLVNCFDDPCRVATCQSSSFIIRWRAKCESSYCRGCNRNWHVDLFGYSFEVTQTCEGTT